MKKQFLPVILSAVIAFGLGTAGITASETLLLNASASESITIAENLSLTEDIVYDGDLIITGGTLKLNGHSLTVKGSLIQGVFLSDNAPDVLINENGTLTVEGDYIHYGGKLNFDAGTLRIKGDYRQNYTGRDENTSGVLEMDYEESLMEVDGDAVFYSESSSDWMTNGVLRIGGNLSVTDAGNCFHSRSSHVTEFKGKKTHTVEFADGNVNYLNLVRVTDGGKLFLKGSTPCFSLDSDITLAGGSTVKGNRTFNLRGYSLTVDGDFWQGGFLTNDAPGVVLNFGETMNVTGDYRHLGGNLEFKGGTLNINGDYRQDVDGRSENSTSVLVMAENSKSLMDVDGNAVFHSKTSADWQTTGVLRIGGDLTVTDGGKCFQSRSEHVTEFKGDAVHTVNFASAGVNHFNLVRMTGNGEILLTGKTAGFTMDSDIVLADGSEFHGGTIALHGHHLTVNGDFWQGAFLAEESPKVLIETGETMTVTGDYRHLCGTLQINDGALYINGDYRQDADGRGENSTGVLVMEGSKKAGIMDIDGNAVFHSKSSADWQTTGVLRIGGDLTVTDGGKCFQSRSEHVTEFKGDAVHTVNFASAGVNRFNLVRMTGNGEILLTNNTAGFTMDSDIVLAGGSEFHGGTIALNGHHLTVNGDFWQGSFLKDESPTVSIKTAETMTVKGDYHHFCGAVNISDGALYIKGSYRQDADGRGENSTGTLAMEGSNNKALMEIDGDAVFHSKSSSDWQTTGILCIGGNLTVTNAGGCFHSRSGHTTAFKGSKEHIISFAGTNNYFNMLQICVGDTLRFTGNLSEISQKSGTITVTPEMLASVADLTVTGETAGSGTIKFANASSSVSKKLTVIEGTKPAEESKIRGDVTGDGKINSYDLILLKKHLLGTVSLSDQQILNADVNSSGEANIADAVQLQHFLNGRIQKLDQKFTALRFHAVISSLAFASGEGNVYASGNSINFSLKVWGMLNAKDAWIGIVPSGTENTLQAFEDTASSLIDLKTYTDDQYIGIALPKNASGSWDVRIYYRKTGELVAKESIKIS